MSGAHGSSDERRLGDWEAFGLAFIAAILLCAVATYLVMLAVPWIQGGYRREPLLGGAYALAVLSQAAAVPVLAWAFFRRSGGALMAAKALAAVLTACVAVAVLFGAAEHDNALFDGAARTTLAGLAAAGLAAYGIGIPLAARRIPGRSRKPVYLAAVTAVVGGFFIGAAAWSETMPGRIAAAAAEAAGGRPFCLMPGPGREPLKGFALRSIAVEGFHDRYHAVLVVEGAAGREFLNWSFRGGRFEPVSGKPVGFSRQFTCLPVEGGYL